MFTELQRHRNTGRCLLQTDRGLWRGVMMHKTSDSIESGAVIKTVETPEVEGQPICPYTLNSVHLLENAYPDRLMNATCDCNDCQTEGVTTANTACRPQSYHVPIIMYQSIRIQTDLCIIRDFTVEFVKIATVVLLLFYHKLYWFHVFRNILLVQIRHIYFVINRIL